MKKKIAQLGQSYNFPAETKERNGVSVTFPEYTVMQVSDPQKPKGEWPESSHKFIFTIKGKTFDYFTGLAHRQGIGFDKKEYERLSRSNINDYGLKTERHESRDVFIDAKTARKHAEFWAYECKQCGYITTA